MNQDVFREVKTNIINSDIEATRASIEKFTPPVYQMSYDDYHNLYATFLNIAVKQTSNEAKEHMFEAIMDMFNTEDDYIPFYSRIWIIRRSSDETLAYLKEILPYSFSTYIKDLARFETFPQEKYSVIPMIDAVKRLEKVFGKPDGNSLIELRRYMTSYRDSRGYINDQVLAYVESSLLSYYGEDIKTAKIPEYIEDLEYGQDNEEIMTKAGELASKVTPLSVKGYELAMKLADAVPDGELKIKDDDKTLNMREYIYRSTVVLTPYELKELVSESKHKTNDRYEYKYDPVNLETLEDDAVVMIQILGPVNPFGVLPDEKTLKETIEDYKTIYDRMFTCICYENSLEEDEGDREEDEEVDIFSWFSGICDKCSLAIEKPWYAVRAPVLPGGGWVGCYCSWKCVREDMKNMSPDMESYINQFERQINEYKIHDREWN